MAVVMICAIMYPLFLTGCSESPIDAQVNTPAPIEQQVTPQEHWITAMDPFVTQGTDGMYTFDEVAFGDAYGVLVDSDLVVVAELKASISVANQKIREDTLTGSLAKIWFYRYWWGYKECYSELSAEYMLDLMSISVVTWPAYFSAKSYYYRYGQFCINRSWVGMVWITPS